MRYLWAILFFVLASWGASQRASADIIEVDFAGTVTAGARIDSSGNLVSIRGDAFSSTFIFDTSLGTLQTINNAYQLVGGFVSGSFDGSGINPSGLNTLVWSDGATGPTIVSASARGWGPCGNCSVVMSSTGSSGSFQFDNICPSPRGICGNVEISSVVATITPSAVPGPTVGGGASSLALAALFLGWLIRRRSNQFALSPLAAQPA